MTRQPAADICLGAAAAVWPTTPGGRRRPELHTIPSRRAACARMTEETSRPDGSPARPQYPSDSVTREGCLLMAADKVPRARVLARLTCRTERDLSLELPKSPLARRAAPTPDWRLFGCRAVFLERGVTTPRHATPPRLFSLWGGRGREEGMRVGVGVCVCSRRGYTFDTIFGRRKFTEHSNNWWCKLCCVDGGGGQTKASAAASYSFVL